MKIASSYVLLATVVYLSFASAASENAKNACMLPPTPNNGQYIANRLDNPDLTKAYEFLALNYTCSHGYEILGKSVRLCIKGTWSSEEPKCLRMCKVPQSSTTEFVCVTKGAGFRHCKESEPEGTLVRVRCSNNNYYYPGELPNMHCVDGNWDNIPICIPECGIFPSPSTESTDRKPWSTPLGQIQVPWFATIYKLKDMQPRMQCGATIISKNVVLTAAHCLWDSAASKSLLPEELKVAVGNLVVKWKASEEGSVQKFDVAHLIVHPAFKATPQEYRSDIGVVTLAKDITFSPDVRPVCLDFDSHFEVLQLQEKAQGMFAGWGPLSNDEDNNVLKVLEMPYVPLKECFSTFPGPFRNLLTSDKMCAGYKQGTGLCLGDSGGGLTFPEEHRGVTKYYLRGIVSVSMITSTNPPCVKDSLAVFTQISNHKNFIKEYL